LTASWGIAVSNGEQSVDPQPLLHLADEAPYRAKADGRKGAEFAAGPELAKSS
jgi:GGDEF domain-containing protein